MGAFRCGRTTSGMSTTFSSQALWLKSLSSTKGCEKFHASPMGIKCCGHSTSLGGDAERPKATLKNPDLHEGIKVKWVYEGCVAYPVEVDDVADDTAMDSIVTKPKARLVEPFVQEKL